jgi:hypothetical protein
MSKCFACGSRMRKSDDTDPMIGIRCTGCGASWIRDDWYKLQDAKDAEYMAEEAAANPGCSFNDGRECGRSGQVKLEGKHYCPEHASILLLDKQVTPTVWEGAMERFNRCSHEAGGCERALYMLLKQHEPDLELAFNQIVETSNDYESVVYQFQKLFRQVVMIDYRRGLLDMVIWHLMNESTTWARCVQIQYINTGRQRIE